MNEATHDEKMKAKHPPQANPNRGYSYVGQENVANISGYEKSLGPGKTRDIKVSKLCDVQYCQKILTSSRKRLNSAQKTMSSLTIDGFPRKQFLGSALSLKTSTIRSSRLKCTNLTAHYPKIQSECANDSPSYI